MCHHIQFGREAYQAPVVKLRRKLSILGLLWFGHKINFLTSKVIEAKEAHGSFTVNMEESTEGCLAMRTKHADMG